MARRVAVEVLCDIDGTPGATPVRFGLDGIEYTIDLSDKRAAELRRELARYVSAGRRIGKSKSRGTGAAPRRRNGEVGEARDWALQNGISVVAIGRMPVEVLAKFRARKERLEGEKAADRANLVSDRLVGLRSVGGDTPCSGDGNGGAPDSP
ncbi:Lsr2 family protein [Amycolatopsis sp. SID8362]|uniref:histone-like nucleoid-structuring protein Lsr2 n=1 Tax=Amycolatopsis sp. SID8362 TaxID=2690346 RepID=UPI00136C90AC|nr:Lsr2 family protein [Amycolatopsis sp. SID8362]NBH03501.1 Lsr2 family protein [Amycolatopsis sp. SID8362]NED40201.1 Lsr2 family protein [Amycolatopsis sp. SID8362]